MTISRMRSQPFRSCWLPVIPPMQLMLGAMVLCFLQTFVAVEWQLKQAYFGLPLQVHDQQVVLTDFHGHPNIHVSLGEVLGVRFPLTPQMLMPDPDFFNGFNELNAFFAEQGRVFNLLNQASQVHVWSADQHRFDFERKTMRLVYIPAAFWAYQCFGAIALLIGTAFWSFNRGQAITRILLLAAVGFALMHWTMALYSTRELALAGALFNGLVWFNHLGGMLFALSSVTLLMYYPQYKPVRGFIPIAALVFIFCGINEQAQWIEWPINIFYFPSLALLSAFCWLAGRQFVLCRNHSAQRVQWLWLIGILLSGLGIVFALYVVPMLLLNTTWLSLTAANAVALLVFIGFVLGVQRSELFGVHQWWLRSWFVSGVVFVLIILDVATLFTLGHQAQLGLGLLAFVLAWLYLPIRQVIWRRWVVGAASSIIQFPCDPQLVQLRKTLLAKFSPLHFACISHSPGPIENKNGMELIVPLADEKAFVLIGKKRGFSLFSKADSAFVKELLESPDAQQALQFERDRIMRDLHDDVAADLLTLLHQSKDEIQRCQVRETLANLRAIIYSLQAGELRPLSDFATLWQEDLLRRCRIAECEGVWQQNDIDGVNVLPAQALHLQRIFREAISNALRHAHPTFVNVSLHRDKESLLLEVSNNGTFKPLTQWKKGKGIRSLEHRAQQLQGQTHWQVDDVNGQKESRFTLVLPINGLSEVVSFNQQQEIPHNEHLAA